MKKYLTRYATALCCGSLLFAGATIPTQAKSEIVNEVKGERFGLSNLVDWNGVFFQEEGRYEILKNISEDYASVRVYYYFHVWPGNSGKDPTTVHRGYSYQTNNVFLDINCKNPAIGNVAKVHTFPITGNPRKDSENFLYAGIHLQGTADIIIKRGEQYTFRLWDIDKAGSFTSALDIEGKAHVDYPTYKVDFTNSLGNIVSSQSVVRHQSAKAPTTNPTLLGYEFKRWDKSYSPITSNLTVNAIWDRLPPVIKRRETVYEKNENVAPSKLIENALATDTREGDIRYKVVVISPIVQNNKLDTSTEGTFPVTYQITNTDDLYLDAGKSAQIQGKIHIVDTHSHLVFDNQTDANVYARYISKNKTLDDNIPLDNLISYSLWRKDGAANRYQDLSESLNRTTPLPQYDYINTNTDGVRN